MTKLLEQAFDEAATFPPVDQNAFAWWLLDEMKCCEDDRPSGGSDSDGNWTALLRYAFVHASMLPDQEQDEAARFLMDDIEDERRWAESFAKSGDLLARMAAEATADDEAGLTEPLDPESL